MRTIICSFCAKSGVLCPACEAKLKSGEITKEDIEICKYLYSRFENVDAEYIGSFSTKNFLILLMKGDVGSIVGKSGKGVQEMKKKFGKKIKIINLDMDKNGIVSDLIYPATLIGINLLFKEGKEVLRIRIKKDDLMKIPIDITSLNKILSNIFKKDVLISFE